MSTTFASEYTDILHKYEALLREMVENRQAMLAAVTAGKFTAVQSAMNAAQADAMRMEKIEARRLQLQAQNALAQSSIHEAMAQFPPTEQARLLPLVNSVARQVEELRFLGEKSIAMAQCNLMEMDPRLMEEALQKTEDGAPAASYEKQRHTGGQRPSIETKA